MADTDRKNGTQDIFMIWVGTRHSTTQEKITDPAQITDTPALPGY
jgi:hypothetical protein